MKIKLTKKPQTNPIQYFNKQYCTLKVAERHLIAADMSRKLNYDARENVHNLNLHHRLMSRCRYELSLYFN